MERVQSAMQELSNALQESHTEFCEKLQERLSGFDRNMATIAARFRVARHVIETLIDTHPDLEALRDTWGRMLCL